MARLINHKSPPWRNNMVNVTIPRVAIVFHTTMCHDSGIDRRTAPSVEAIVHRLQQEAMATGLSKARLAQACQLHFNTLRNYDQPDWNPSLSTLKKIERYLDTLNTGATDPSAGLASQQA